MKNLILNLVLAFLAYGAGAVRQWIKLEIAPALPPAPTIAGSNARMAGNAKTHEVSRVMGSAFAEGNDVMHFLGRCGPAFLFTNFTQRML